MYRILILNPYNLLIRPLVFKREFNIKKTLGILVFLTILSLLAFSVLQLNTYTKERYLIGDYENKLNQLTQENKLLEINFSQANSLNHLGNYVQNQIFEKAERIEYIRVLEGTVLAK